MIDLRQLQALSAVADEGSVARAATRLGWSQPTVDYHLRNLDRLVGASLTQRGPRGSSLTPTGLVVIERGREILTLAERALTDARDLSQLGHTKIHFGTFPTAAARLLPGIASRLTELGIGLDATLAEVAPLVTAVNQQSLDAALVYAARGYTLPFRSDVHTTRIYTDPLWLALPHTHSLAQSRTVTREDFLSLHTENWVLGATPGDTIDDIVREEFRAAGHELSVAIRTDDYSVLLGLVAAGLAVALVPSLATTTPPDGVALIDIDDERFARELILAAPGAGTLGPSAAVKQLAEAVRRALQTHLTQ